MFANKWVKKRERNRQSLSSAQRDLWPGGHQLRRDTDELLTALSYVRIQAQVKASIQPRVKHPAHELLAAIARRRRL